MHWRFLICATEVRLRELAFKYQTVVYEARLRFWRKSLCAEVLAQNEHKRAPLGQLAHLGAGRPAQTALILNVKKTRFWI